MELKQQVTTKQTLALTQTMRQSLACLQMSVLELRDYIQESIIQSVIGNFYGELFCPAFSCGNQSTGT